MAVAYEWDFSGSYMPKNGVAVYGSKTFSVGIFQWLPKSSSKGLKKSAVAKRIRGYASNAESVYEQARQECERRNAGEPKLAEGREA